MTKETSEAIEWLLANADSVDGTINCTLKWDNFLGCWLLEAISNRFYTVGGSISLMLSSTEVAMEVFKQLPLI